MRYRFNNNWDFDNSSAVFVGDADLIKKIERWNDDGYRRLILDAGRTVAYADAPNSREALKNDVELDLQKERA